MEATLGKENITVPDVKRVFDNGFNYYRPLEKQKEDVRTDYSKYNRRIIDIFRDVYSNRLDTYAVRGKKPFVVFDVMFQMLQSQPSDCVLKPEKRFVILNIHIQDLGVCEQSQAVHCLVLSHFVALGLKDMRQTEYHPPLDEPADLEDVDGFRSAARRVSHTTAAGVLRLDPIEGVRYRLARPVSHYHGHLTEIYRDDWSLTNAALVQVTMTTTFPGRIRAWGLHCFTIDRLFAATGSLMIICYDARRASATYRSINEFMLGGRNQGLVLIPPGVYHGWKNVGDDEATIISMPSRLYDYDAPDRWELPWDSAEAHATIPYRWP